MLPKKYSVTDDLCSLVYLLIRKGCLSLSSLVRDSDFTGSNGAMIHLSGKGKSLEGNSRTPVQGTSLYMRAGTEESHKTLSR